MLMTLLQILVNISILTRTCKSLVAHLAQLHTHFKLAIQILCRVPSAKRHKISDSNSLYPDANSHRSTQGPLQNANGSENDRFNLDYGGILDEDMREVAPLPVKSAQVKVRL